MLIGGSAAWFYRLLVEKEQDPDFPPIEYNASEEACWYSKDVDFIGTKRKDFCIALNTVGEGTPPRVIIAGVWIDTPDEGVFLTRESALKTAIEVTNPRSLYKVASPILLVAGE